MSNEWQVGWLQKKNEFNKFDMIVSYIARQTPIFHSHMYNWILFIEYCCHQDFYLITVISLVGWIGFYDLIFRHPLNATIFFVAERSSERTQHWHKKYFVSKKFSEENYSYLQICSFKYHLTSCKSSINFGGFLQELNWVTQIFLDLFEA